MLKPLTVIAAVLCVTGLGLYVYDWNSAEGPKTRRGQLLIVDLDTKSLKALRIRSEKGILELHQSKGGEWREKGLDYPLAEGKIQDLLLELTKLKLGDLVTGNPERHERFQLLDPPESQEDWDENRHALVLSMLKGDGSTLFDLRLGKDREQGSGQYVRYAGDDDVYLLPETLFIDTDPNDWLEKNLLTINKEDFRKVTIHHFDEEPFSLLYDNSTSSWSMTGGGELKESEVESMVDRLTKLNFTKLVEGDPPDNKTGRSRLSRVELLLYDGKIYNLGLGENENAEGNHVLNLRMSIQVDSDSEEFLSEMKAFNHKVSSRLYEIRSWEAKDLLKKRTDFLEGG